MMYFKALVTGPEWDWFASRTKVIACADTQGIVAYDENGDINAICVFDSLTVDACSVHLAIDNPFVIRHGFLNEIAHHAFITLQRERIFGLVPSTNEKARKLDIHIGFTEVARIPDAVADGVDYIVLRLDKADCRWLEQDREVA